MARGYYWTVAVCTAFFSTATFATDYTWTGEGGDDHLWTNVGNWARSGGGSGYPNGSGDLAIFTNCEMLIEVEVPSYVAPGTLRVMDNAKVRFYASDPNVETKFDLKSAWNLDYANISVEFDHIFVPGNKALTLGSCAIFTAKNGSDLRLGNTTVKKAARVSVLSGSIISTSGLDIRPRNCRA